MGCVIIGCGKALPALEVENDELSKLVDTSDEWISTRTGIKSRRIAVAETNVDLAEAAAREALCWGDVSPCAPQEVSSTPTDSGCMLGGSEYTSTGFGRTPIDPESIDLVVYSTITPDTLVPSCAALLRRRLGLTSAVCFDINAACSGFVYGISLVESMMAASAAAAFDSESANPSRASRPRRNIYRRALVIGSERLTRLTDWNDRATCVLFGDGAGAAVIEWDDACPGILATYIANEDDYANALTCPMAFDAPQPFDDTGVSKASAIAGDPALRRIDEELAVDEVVAAGRPRQTVYMHGQRVFKFAVEAMTRAMNTVCERAGVSLDDVKCIVPHQANDRIIRYAAKQSGVPYERFQVSIAHWGNSSSACLPMALADAYESGRIQQGDKVLLVAFGGGFTSGAILFESAF